MAITKLKTIEDKKESIGEVFTESTNLGFTPQVDVEDLSLEDLVEYYATLKDQVDALANRPEVFLFAEAGEELKSRLADQYQPTDVLSIKGKSWLVSIGAAAKSPDKIKSVELVEAALGRDIFLKLATVTLGNLLKYLTPDQYEICVNRSDKYTNTRRIKTTYLGK